MTTRTTTATTSLHFALEHAMQNTPCQSLVLAAAAAYIARLGGNEDDLRREIDRQESRDVPYEPRRFYCAICQMNEVAALDGYDTCEECLSRQ